MSYRQMLLLLLPMTLLMFTGCAYVLESMGPTACESSNDPSSSMLVIEPNVVTTIGSATMMLEGLKLGQALGESRARSGVDPIPGFQAGFETGRKAANYKILVNGQYWGKNNCQQSGLTPGCYQVEVVNELTGKSQLSTNVSVSGGQKLTVRY